MHTLQYIAKQLVAPGKGILAADESPPTNKKRFDKYGIPDTEEMRRKWRQLLFTTPGIERGLSGVILFDETMRQKTDDDVPFADFLTQRGIIAGIKVDQKTGPFGGGEEVTKGLDGLAVRLAEYAKMGAQFTKWRAVIRIGADIPTGACIEENARRMAEYARESQNAGMVPIIEPEVLLNGTHTLARCEEIVRQALTEVFKYARSAEVALNGLLLKTSMVLPGKESGEKVTVEQVAEATVRALTATVPKEVVGIVFLSGGQGPEEATKNLNAIVLAGREAKAPWPLSFSFSRALQDPVMAVWAGKEENVKKAQNIFAQRVSETARAARGEFNG